MLRWCAYCHKYLGESEPFEDYSISHGICELCESNWKMSSSSESMERLEPLREVQRRLHSAGQSGNLSDARAALSAAVRLGVRPIDFLMGILQPCLYEVGDKWAKGQVSVADEHRFTSIASSIIEVASTHSGHFNSLIQAQKPRVVLANSLGNIHTLGIQLVELYLLLNGVSTYRVQPDCTGDSVVEHVASLSPEVLGISMALPAHFTWASEVAERLRISLPVRRPIIALGGHVLRRDAPVVLPHSDLAFCQSPSELLNLLSTTGTEKIN